MKKYIVPEIELVALTSSDILNDSDTIIDIKNLYEVEASLTSEFTGERIEV